MTNDPTDDLLDLFYSYPLYFALEDCYVPEVAAPLLAALFNLDDESAEASIKLCALDAMIRMEEQVN